MVSGAATGFDIGYIADCGLRIADCGLIWFLRSAIRITKFESVFWNPQSAISSVGDVVGLALLADREVNLFPFLVRRVVSIGVERGLVFELHHDHIVLALHFNRL